MKLYGVPIDFWRSHGVSGVCHGVSGSFMGFKGVPKTFSGVFRGAKVVLEALQEVPWAF